MALAPYSHSTSRPRTDEVWNARFSGKATLTGVKHVLSIQVDALLGFVDDAATARLWKVFTHCAGSIAHGRRLENLSWRTWSAQQAQAQASVQNRKQHRVLHSSSSFDSTALTSITDSESSRCDSDLARRPSDATASESSLCSPKPPQDNQISPHSQQHLHERPQPRPRNESSSSTASHDSNPPYFRYLNASPTHSGPHFSSSAPHSPSLAFLIKKVILTPPIDPPPLDALFPRHQDQTCNPFSFEHASTATMFARLSSYPAFLPTSSLPSDHHPLREEADTQPASEDQSASGTSTVVPTTPDSSSHASSTSATRHLSSRYLRQSGLTSNWENHRALSASVVPSPNGSLHTTKTDNTSETVEDIVQKSVANKDFSPAPQQEDLAVERQRHQVSNNITTQLASDNTISASDTVSDCISPTTTQAASIFPTVVVLQSTPKPTPPDTPARCLSPPTPFHLHPLSAFVTPLSSDIIANPIQESAQSPESTHAAASKAFTGTDSSTIVLQPPPHLSPTAHPQYPQLPGLLHQSETSLSSSSSAAVRYSPFAAAAGKESGSSLTSGSCLNTGHRTQALASVSNSGTQPKSDPSTTKGESSVAGLARETALSLQANKGPRDTLFGSRPREFSERPQAPFPPDELAGPQREGGHFTSSGVDHRLGRPSAKNAPIQSGFDETVLAHKGPSVVAPVKNGVSPLPPQRMFFLQRDSTSFSPDSNSRSGSHSRSPGSTNEQTRGPSRSPDQLAATISSSSHSRSPERFPSHHVRLPDSQTRSSDRGDLSAVARSSTGQHSLPHDRVQSLRTEAALDAVDSSGRGEVVQSARFPDSRASGPPHQQQPVYPASSQDEMQLQLQDGAARSAESSHQLPSPTTESSQGTSSRSRVNMRSKRAANRANVGRGVERPSSRNSGARRRYDASVDSREGGVKRGRGIGSLDVNAGSMSAADSVSTSSSSKLVMARPQRLHAASRIDSAQEPTLPAAGDVVGLAGQHERSQVDPRSSHQSQRAGNRILSPLAALPDPKLENFQRQVMETTRQGGGRRLVALESDSDSDVTSDEDEEDGDGTKKLPLETGSIKVEDGASSWSDESDEDEAAEPQTRRNQARGHGQPPVRKDSKDHPVGSAGSGRLPARHPHVHGHTKPHAPLPHVKSKAKITHHNQGASPPPTRNAVARVNSSGHMPQHRRSASSGEGPLAQAAREAQRQRDMFTPLPRESYSSTNLVREKSLTSLSRGGRPSNLTLLLNPDPHLFSPEHPYRKQTPLSDPKLSKSMEELHARMTNAAVFNGNARNGAARSSRPGVGLGFGGLRMTSAVDVTAPRRVTRVAPSEQVAPPEWIAPPTPIVQPPTPAVAPVSPAPAASQSRTPHRPQSSLDMSRSPPAPSKLRPSKSSVAIPVVLGVTASSAPRDNDRGDLMEMSLRQMGSRHPRVSRFQQASVAQPSNQQPEGSQSKDGTSRGYRLGGAPVGVDFSDSEDEEDVSPQTKTSGASGKSLAHEHLKAVMEGKDAKTLTNLSSTHAVVASPDKVPNDPRQPEASSYRPPAPPSSPSNPFQARPAQGQQQLPPNPRLGPVRPRPHSSHGTPAPAAPATMTAGPTAAVTRERRQPATSQPPVPFVSSVQPQQQQQPSRVEVPFPYNLPFPAPVQSPRTTRLKMLAAEVPDDLRKDLLWERKTNRITSNTNIAGTSVAPPLRRVSGAAGNVGPLRTVRVEGGPSPNDRVPIGGVNAEQVEESMEERLERAREAKERYDKMRTRTWNGVIYQRPVW